MSRRSVAWGVAQTLPVALAVLYATAPEPAADAPLRTSAAEPQRSPSEPEATEGAATGFPEEAGIDVLGSRRIELPQPGAAPPDPRAAFCDERHWSRIGVDVFDNGAGEFLVDQEDWESRLTTARAGLASWMSECRRGGGSVTIVARGSGAVLATYDPRAGLRSHLP
jgi:hypothetical protein